MNKKLILVVLLAACLVAVFAYVYAKHTNKPAAEKPSMEIGPPPAERLVDRDKVDRLTQEDFRNYVDAMGKRYATPEERAAERADFDPYDQIKILRPKGEEGEVGLRPMDYCAIEVLSWSGGAYYYPNGDPHANCWDCAEWFEFNDIEFFDDPEDTLCRFPYYPFEIQELWMHIFAQDVCTLKVQFRIDFPIYWLVPGPFPYYTSPLYQSDTLIVYHPGGHGFVHHTLTTPLCVYDRFFVGFAITNSEQFSHPDSCPDAPYLAISAVYDRSCVRGPPRYYHCYWRPDCAGGGLYTMCDLGDGSTRLWAEGFSGPQNECEPETTWTWKDSFPEYAPDGMPDFHQYDEDFPDSGAAYCGPTALANCLWWMASAEIIWPFWDDTDSDGDNWNPGEVDSLINLLAGYCNTDPGYGTTPGEMDDGIEQLKADYSLWITHDEVPMPTFEYIQYELRRCQDVILLLGFWYFDEDTQEWLRIGGHWVTMAGVDYIFWNMAISDPALNLMCNDCTVPDTLDMWKSDGRYLPHVPPPDSSHDDAGNVSHDARPGYHIGASPSPGGVIGIDNYPVYMLDLEKFLGLNVPPQFEQYQVTEIPKQLSLQQIYTEIEVTKVLCPESRHYDKLIESSRFQVEVSNEGNVGTDITWHHPNGVDTIHAGYDGSLILGTEGNLTLAYGEGENCYIPFFPQIRWIQDTLYFTRTNPGGAPIVYTFPRHYTVFRHKSLPLEVEAFFIGAFDPEEGPCEDAVWVKYVIHNYGDVPIDSIEKALYIDLDVPPDPLACMVNGDSTFGTIWSYNVAAPNILFGMTQKPVYVDGGACGGRGASQPVEVWPWSGFQCDSLKLVMKENAWNMNPYDDQPTDVGVMLITYEFSLAPSQPYCNEYIIWAYDKNDPVNGLTLGEFLYELMKQEGYYRGDVNCDGKCDVVDLVYLVGYVFKGGSGPLPFDDQGDVNCDANVDVVDIVYLVGYVFKQGPPPIDKNRFFDEPYKTMFTRPGLVADPVWNTLPYLVDP